MSQSPGTPSQPNAPLPDDSGLDAAQQSLSDALRVSFFLLKVLMIVLLVIYLYRHRPGSCDLFNSRRSYWRELWWSCSNSCWQ